MSVLRQVYCWMWLICLCVCVRACAGVRDCWECILCCWVCWKCVRPLRFDEMRISLLTWMSRSGMTYPHVWHDSLIQNCTCDMRSARPKHCQFWNLHSNFCVFYFEQ